MKKHTFLICICLIFCYPMNTAAESGSGIWDYIFSQTDEAGKLQVHFLDVGQGDSMLIQTPSHYNILVDGGDGESGEKVISELSARGVKKLDLLVATHPDIDHIGGLLPVLEKFKVKQVLDSGKLYTTRTYQRYTEILAEKQIPVTIAKEGSYITVDPLLSLQVLNANHPKATNNQASIVLRLTYRTVDFLLMSDAEAQQEYKMKHNYEVESEVYKVAHHGSRTSNTFAFLKKVKPDYAVVSYGRDNQLGHPTKEVVRNLQKAGAVLYATAKGGTISIETNGLSCQISSEKPNPIFNKE
ncbi:Metal-dependent hydrolase, beta-lactamase superfamily II [Terribacillus saccharophilus]|uniref:Metal-dependent hydrolase, beta-lactamase superfamily II n=1 Tax=Terribacillus saccharophilus TaxID=361277 RepID=A0AAX2EKP3_9BACI|nr:ComEC/Rec2 family competence protein [Terribacillus saccharophilus]MEC0292132.1 ComEC/Rec2 family competence protein [Terribacillus saccharophilus]SEO23320.1 Metal-dependent hydrolase, beta-lactamase superfamily II [Terribacillus saccharophilus]